MKIRNPIWTKHTDSHLMEISNGFFLVGSSQNCLERKTTGGWNGRRRRTSVVCTAEVPRLMVLRTVHRLFLYGRPVHPASGARLGAKPEVKRSSRERKREKEKKTKKKLLFQLLLSVRRYNSSWWSVARVEEYSIERWAAENVLAHARQHPSRAVAHRHFLSGITRDVDICFLPMYRTQVELGFAVFCCYCHPLDSIGGIDNFYTKCWLCTMHREVSLFLSPDESDVIRHSPMRRPTWPPLASVYSSR